MVRLTEHFAETFSGKPLHLYGWGIEGKLKQPDKLLTADFKGGEIDKACKDAVKQDGLTEDCHLCASSNSSDACEGDSGGESFKGLN